MSHVGEKTWAMAIAFIARSATGSLGKAQPPSASGFSMAIVTLDSFFLIALCVPWGLWKEKKRSLEEREAMRKWQLCR